VIPAASGQVEDAITMKPIQCLVETAVYFRDPAGNSVELITPGLWGLPGGW
jgi:hypothetical protein